VTQEHDIATADGRTLRVVEDGQPDGAPVLVHGGTPNSRLLFEGDIVSARRHGIRLISYDRPGYGGSTRRAGRRVGDCAADVRAIADGLGIDRLGVWGVSGGGPHALACAALLGNLVPAVAALASVAPWGAEGLDYFAGMGTGNVADTELLFANRAAARTKCDRDREEWIAIELPALMESLAQVLVPVDAAALDDALGAFLIRATRSGLAPGADGWWDDSVAYVEPWGFDLAAITTPVLIVHGRQDRFVPVAHGEWLAAHVRGAETIIADNDGHLSIGANHLDRVHAWLRERLG
jgi:pimeloyl-ACP methyl ester carboxylesterase